MAKEIIIDDDENNIHSCINRKIFINGDNEKVYCKNYYKAKDGE